MHLNNVKIALSRVEHSAPDSALSEIAWMVGGFPASHPVRKQALGLPRLEVHLATHRPCGSEIHTIMRVATHRDDDDTVGAVAKSLHAVLCAGIR